MLLTDLAVEKPIAIAWKHNKKADSWKGKITKVSEFFQLLSLTFLDFHLMYPIDCFLIHYIFQV